MDEVGVSDRVAKWGGVAGAIAALFVFGSVVLEQIPAFQKLERRVEALEQAEREDDMVRQHLWDRHNIGTPPHGHGMSGPVPVDPADHDER